MGTASGLRVLVTRPRDRAAGLIAALEAAGFRPVPLPTIEIEPLPRPPVRAGDHDVVIFLSPAAVAHGADLLQPRAAAEVGAVGPASADALRARGHRITLEPVGSADSEGLLRHPALAAARIAGRRVLLVRGAGGREHLAQSLVARGATVDYAEVYRRTRPRASARERSPASDITTVTSNEGMTNLLALLAPEAHARILRQPLVVASARAAEYARELGFAARVEIASGADDAAMLAAVQRCADTFPPGAPGSA